MYKHKNKIMVSENGEKKDLIEKFDGWLVWTDKAENNTLI
jgi:hypothetical protein